MPHPSAARALALACAALPAALAAQEAPRGAGRVQGQVTGNGQPVANAQVTLVGTRLGAVTRQDGRFVIAGVPAGRYTVRVQRIGFTPRTQAVTVADGQTVDANFALDAAVALLQEVQVQVGYTNQQRRDVSDATAGVTGAEIRDQKVATVEEAFRGRIPGVQVIASGEPGRAPQVLVRGQNNFNNTSPLYVVDGMYLSQNPNLNPDDIESIEVLKDASAAAQYGAQAANGVVVIRTRRGRAGQNAVDLRTYYGYQTVPTRIAMADARRWAEIQQQTYLNAGRAVPAGITAAINGSTVSTDWQDALLRTGAIQDYNLGVSGGSSTANYLLSGGYLDQKGAIVGTGFNRYSVRGNTELSRGRLRVGQNLAVSQTNKQNPVGAPLLDAVRFPPTIPVLDPNSPSGFGYGSDAVPTYGTNPVGVQQLRPSRYRSNQVIGSAFGEVQLVGGLSYRLNLGTNYNAFQQRDFSSIAQLRYLTPNQFATLTNADGDFQSVLVENLLQVDRAFGGGRHRVTAAGGFTNYRQDFDSLLAFRQGFTDETLQTIDAGAQAGQRTGGQRVQQRLASQLLRASYVYADRYIVTGSVRRDGSSRFSADNRWGTFGAGSVAWVVSEEPFFRRIPGLNRAAFFKLRGSTGVLGNQEIGDYQFAAVLDQNRNYGFNGGTAGPSVGTAQLVLANPNLRWQSNRTHNAGLDLGVLGGNLSFTADYYVAQSNGLLVNIPIPVSLGAIASAPVNAGGVRNAGVELGATHRLRRGGFELNTTATFTTNRNRVTSLGNGGQPIFGGPGGVTRTAVGGPAGTFYVVRTAGVFQSQAEVDAYVNARGERIQPNARPGDLRFADVNGDGVFNFDTDRYNAGNGTPRYSGGLFLDSRWRGVDVGLNLRGAGGFKIFNGIRYWTDRGDEPSGLRAGFNPWTASNPSATTPRITALGNDNNLFQSDRWLERGDFLRVQNLIVGYTIPERFTRRLGALGAAGAGRAPRVYVNAQNLLTFTGFSNWDPEAVGNGGVLERGVDDARVFPQVRTFTLGLDLRL